MPPTKTIPPAQLRLIRTALFMGPAIFGALAWYLRSQRTEHPQTPEELAPLRMAAYVFCGMAVVGVSVIRGIRARRAPAERGTASLMGWAVAESGALLGATYYFLGGEPWPYLIGMVVILGSWGLLPVDPDEA